MATTTPDGLFSPGAEDPYNLTADWAASMSSVQLALLNRANHVGTTAQRNAFAAQTGALWWDTTLLQAFIYNGSAWVAMTPEADKDYTYTGPTSNLSSLTLVYSRRNGVTQAVGQFRLNSGWSMGDQKIVIPSGSIPSEWRPSGSRIGSVALVSGNLHRGGDITFGPLGEVFFGMSDTPPSTTDMRFTATWVR